MIDQLCQAYHWTFDDAMSKTLPQIILLNHAASVNTARSKARSEAKSKANKKVNSTDPVVSGGKRLSEMTSEEMAEYYSAWP